MLRRTFWLTLLSGSGGTLAIAMMGKDIWQSSHFATACVMLGLLAMNGAIAFTGFGNDAKSRKQGRTMHAWLGVAIIAVIFAHAATGFALFE